MSQTVNMVYYTCWVCGIPFSAPDALARSIRRDNKTLYCPSGCKLGLGESEAEKLRKKLERQEEMTRRQQLATQRANARLQDERRSHAGTKGALTKTKKRVAGGACPCCNRWFPKLKRHMKSKHPDYADQG